ncbi:MAG: efflux RND transporter permease subunit [Rhodospirillaceae bacterium]|jgi:multidrug efflux pump subunit AcrB|nr:efflux RND transporter permease subunit [Rhodospirillaceae bacterium]MBT5244115.1 efflux RND transporter permease subunit [Rhodospirillaceae bacterium]MBT5561640.1 efflux RND transporter permease subunit [Rhodospirillaceae bacterium]MBT6243079.1 efflux RND transporter permease subunit [Rhodospirillaceae bacterium]MBT7137991.1 efflux RND transporter permease subunit [Rhodospirillaceae bacterium]
MKLGLSGGLTKAFIQSPLTPLILLASLAMGAVALMVLPREEEPQISVPMVDIMIQANGYKATDAVELITEPLEDIIKGIDEVEHVYSLSEDDRVVVTARFDVGTSEDVAIVRVHDEIRANMRHLPIGIPEPLIVGRGINDVPVVTLTLKPAATVAERWNDNALYDIAEELLYELVKVSDVGLTFIVGGRPGQIRIEPDPEQLSLYGVTLNQLVEKVKNANRSFLLGNTRNEGRSFPVVAGQTLEGVQDIGMLLITARDGRPVYVRDVADVVVGAKPNEHRVWHLEKDSDGVMRRVPAVTIALAKRMGANAVVVADDILERLDTVRGRLIPGGVEVAVTRNYGATALEKSDELLFHLGLATVSIVLLVTFALGWREGAVVLVVVPTTILLTLFASWLMGYTINRVSLFALIFSIGIMVDDAIVVIENIVRHWSKDGAKRPLESTLEAVAEVGNPTIVATLTIVAALLPMMFVSGLMGPYMSPIPANASAAMVFSFFVAMIITPWLLFKIAFKGKNSADKETAKALSHHAGDGDDPGFLGRLYLKLAAPLLVGRTRSIMFLTIVGIATAAVMVLFATKHVTVKLLPFDNKSEMQIVVDLPEGSSLEETERVLSDVAHRIRDLPELTNMQLYAGTAMPFNFNGLVRHYYMRADPWMGDLQLNLKPKHDRDRQSHEIALEVRKLLQGMAAPEGTSIKVVEVPPGPPVMATLMAEIYGPDQESRRAGARKVRQAFEAIDFIVDVDDSLGQPPQRLRIEIDQQNLEFHGVQEQALYDTLEALIGGVSVGYSQRGSGLNPIEIAVRLPKSTLSMGERLLSTPVPAPGEAADSGAVVELGDVVKLKYERASHPLFRRNGHFTVVVTGEMAGRFEAPIYGMLAIEDKLAEMDWGDGGMPAITYHGQPKDEGGLTLLWDGEWEVTYVTFRDMGLAFIFALLGIYLLVVGQFGSFKLPLVILTPVPLTLIGIMIGHWIFGAPFSATSMIGFIALAGIIVRNSILLVDFIRQGQGKGDPLRKVLLDAGAVRFKPIFLTAVAAMIGGIFILADPIFQGLAISLVFGLASSTALTLLVIPAIYVVLRDDE